MRRPSGNGRGATLELAVGRGERLERDDRALVSVAPYRLGVLPLVCPDIEDKVDAALLEQPPASQSHEMLGVVADEVDAHLVQRGADDPGQRHGADYGLPTPHSARRAPGRPIRGEHTLTFVAAEAERCRVCGEDALPFGSARILASHEVGYYRCRACGFVQTEEPYWLEQAYEQPIAKIDVGIISRNISLADTTSAVISMLFDSGGRFLDWGGGYGILVRLMRDRGFDFYWRDPFCDNLFAQGFEWNDGGRVELVTSFEVLEHLPRPADDCARMAEVTDNLLVSTLLLPEPAPALGDWWYYAPESGQHVSLYSRRSLTVLADQLGMFAASNRGGSVHLLTRSRKAAHAFPFVASRVGVGLRRLLHYRGSLLEADFSRMVGAGGQIPDQR
jgi:methyltransferase family protein